MHVPAADLILVEAFHHAHENCVFRRRKNHNQLFILKVRTLDPVKQVHREIIVHSRNNEKLEIRIFKVFSGMGAEILLASLIQRRTVLNRQPGSRRKFELIDKCH